MRLGFDVESCDLEEQATQFVEFGGAFGYGAAGFKALDEVGEGGEVRGVGVLDRIAEHHDEAGEIGK